MNTPIVENLDKDFFKLYQGRKIFQYDNTIGEHTNLSGNYSFYPVLFLHKANEFSLLLCNFPAKPEPNYLFIQIKRKGPAKPPNSY